MVILDTCILIYDALQPGRLSRKAKNTINQGGNEGVLGCSDISLWEIAMLMGKGRLDAGVAYRTFMNLVLDARSIQVLPITPEIADLSVSLDSLKHPDPADRIISATTINHGGVLVTCDKRLLRAKDIPTIW